MKILIAYTSANGTTAKCAELLSDELSRKNEVTLVDMNKETAPSPTGFDAVLLGSSIRFSRISKKLRAYIKGNMDKLNATKSGMFICCGIPDEFESYVKEQMPKGYKASLGAVYFGGELKPKKLKGFDKLIVRSMRNEITEHDFEDGNYDGVLPDILPENIQNFAECIVRALCQD